jgi:ribosomal protein S18 acetylase RimI-like enzyme
MRGYRLRSAIPSDAAALGALHVASWRETYAGILPNEMLASLSVDARAAMWAGILGDPEAHAGAAVYVAEDRQRLVGFGSCARQRDEALTGLGFSGEIGAIYVLRSHQHLGIGRSIMRLLAQALLDADCRAATLWVLRENLVARSFYEDLGGTVVGEKKDEGPDATLVEVAYGWRDLSVLVH